MDIGKLSKILHDLYATDKNLAHLKFLQHLPDSADIVEVSGNQVFSVSSRSSSGDSVIVKTSPPYMKVLGPQFPLSDGRIHYEYLSLCIYNKLAPGSVPLPITYNDAYKLVVMEKLDLYKSMKDQMLAGTPDQAAFTDVAKALGKVHQEQSFQSLGETKFHDLEAQMQNSAMINLTLDFVFDRPYQKDCPTNHVSPQLKEVVNAIYQKEAVIQAVREMRLVYETKKETLIHGDMTFSSVLTKDGKTKIIDHEFAHVGPASFDVGVFLAHCLMAYHLHLLCPVNNNASRHVAYQYMEECTNFMQAYIDQSLIPADDVYWGNFMHEVAGFTACELMLRVLGSPEPLPVDHISSVEAACLDTATTLLMSRNRIPNVDRLVFIGLKLC